MNAVTSDAYLPERLEALAELTRIGRAREGFDPGLLTESEDVLRRSGERLRLSAGHTVVAIAGGTGSGKSTLFNALSGATFSVPGVTRPTTRDVHACVWGMEGAAPLLDWLGVDRRHRYERASVLDAGEAELHGLVLLDLPDHDSVVTSSAAAVDRISKQADMLIWVLDPQKYADAAVHDRYLVPLAGHSGLFTVVLNQTDTLTDSQAEDCLEDLGRLLESEGLDDAWLHSVSARTGSGLDGLRGLLADAIAASSAAAERIAADIDAVGARYAAYDGGPAAAPAAPAALPAPVAAPAPASVIARNGTDGVAIAPAEGTSQALGTSADGASAVAKPPWEMTAEELAELRTERNRPPWEDALPADPAGREPEPEELAANVPPETASVLIGSLADASGLSAVADHRAGVREAQAARFTGWPPARLFRRSGSAPGTASSAAGLAPQSEVDNAVTAFADAAGGRLPEPWPGAVRRAARSRADEVPPGLAEATRLPDPESTAVPGSWRLAAAWQRLLLVIAVAALTGAVAAGVTHGFGGFGGLGGRFWVIGLAAVVVAALLLGWLTSLACRNLADGAAEHERRFAEGALRGRVTTVARNLVLAPAGRELAAYERFRRELAIARGNDQRMADQ
ncbi:MAG: 50S ribosome-binding GTPase [Streptosporangiales bacterium]|nr:50S ribosome-binding GTPase [Streptosporangiales bacterium]